MSRQELSRRLGIGCLVAGLLLLIYPTCSNLAYSIEARRTIAAFQSAETSAVLGYVEVPTIDLALPIFEGTDEETLQKGAGRLEWSDKLGSGWGAHSVLVAHRGLSSAKLFSDLDRLQRGDIFYVQLTDDRLCYEVDQTLTIEPDDISQLLPVANEDYCTLLTCTPYGVNSHRLLVRGHRIAETNTNQI